MSYEKLYRAQTLAHEDTHRAFREVQRMNRIQRDEILDLKEKNQKLLDFLKDINKAIEGAINEH